MVIKKWEDDNPGTAALIRNEDGTFTGLFYRQDGSEPVSKIYSSREEFKKNRKKDRYELLKND